MPSKAELTALTDLLGRELKEIDRPGSRGATPSRTGAALVDPVRDSEEVARASIEVFRKTLQAHEARPN